MTDAAQARKYAAELLAGLATPETPLRLADEVPREYAWCWVFPFNSERWFTTRSFTDAVVSGPIVVDKESAHTWVAPSSPPLERWLNAHAAERGYDPVPVPEPKSPW